MTWNTWTPPTRAVWPRLAGRVLLLLALCSAWAAQAQWLIGQTAGHTGAVAATVKEATAGAQLYFETGGRLHVIAPTGTKLWSFP